MMSTWSKEELRRIAETDDLHVSPFREDGKTYGTPTWIWSVVVGGAVYVRAYNGQKSSWYQAALRQHGGRITAAGMTKQVTFDSVEGLDDEIDDAYRKKYSGSPYLKPMIGERARSATIRVIPREIADAQKAVASYIGMIPSEHSSGRRQRLGKLSKQGNSLLRFLWVEAAMHAVRRDPELLRFYRRKLVQKWMGIARVAAARKLGIRLWIMLRDEIDYSEFCRRSHLRRQCSGAVCAGMPEANTGPK